MTAPVTETGAKVERYPDVESLSRAAAKQFTQCAREAIAHRNRFTVVLSGGSTPQRLYLLLSSPPFRDNLDWRRVEFFWGDERTVPMDHPDSNFRLAYRAMIEKLPCTESQIHRIQAERADGRAAARDYQEEIARCFLISSEGDPPAFDLILLGLGTDGHTASLFPHTEAVRETRHWVVCNSVPQLKTDRLTLTTPILNRGRTVLFLVAGEDKAEAVHAVLREPTDTDRFPAQLIHPTDGQLVWMVDEAAAARLID